MAKKENCPDKGNPGKHFIWLAKSFEQRAKEAALKLSPSAEAPFWNDLRIFDKSEAKPRYKEEEKFVYFRR